MGLSMQHNSIAQHLQGSGHYVWWAELGTPHMTG